MARTGPMPKRTDQRIRRNKPQLHASSPEVVRISLKDEIVPWPVCPVEDPHSLTSMYWDALRDSPQRTYFQPTDIAMAGFLAEMMDRSLKSGRANGQVLSVILSGFDSLGMSEASRRRAGIEIDRRVDTSVEDASRVVALRKRLGA